MSCNIENYISAVIGAIIGAVIAYFLPKIFNKPPNFRGDLGDDEKHNDTNRKFTKFLKKHEGKIVNLDVKMKHTSHSDRNFDNKYFFSYYYNNEEPLDGGYEFLIHDIDKAFFNINPVQDRLFGKFLIMGITQVQMGWQSINLTPVTNH